MRRLLFNPLAQQPYTSGEYSAQQTAFYIDNEIVDNGLYFCIINEVVAGEQFKQHCCLLYFNEKNYGPDVEYQAFGVADEFKIWTSSYNSNLIFVRYLIDEGVIDSSKEYTIYLYKVI